MSEMAEDRHGTPRSERLISGMMMMMMMMMIKVGTFKYEAVAIIAQTGRFCHICCGG
jgi:hypothetical protein